VGSEESAIQFSATHTSAFCIRLRASAVASEGRKVQIQRPFPPVDVSRPSVMSAHHPRPLNSCFGTVRGLHTTASSVAHGTLQRLLALRFAASAVEHPRYPHSVPDQRGQLREALRPNRAMVRCRLTTRCSGRLPGVFTARGRRSARLCSATCTHAAGAAELIIR
jgi:hypothetical protein